MEPPVQKHLRKSKATKSKQTWIANCCSVSGSSIEKMHQWNMGKTLIRSVRVTLMLEKVAVAVPMR